MTRTLMIHRPPQCPSCHTHSHDERIDLEESYNPPIPKYNEENARKAMQESENFGVSARSFVSDEEDWEERVNKFGWTVQQFKLFDRVARLLDMDRLARLTNTEKQHEPVHRRTIIDKSVSRFRQALSSVSWETRLTRWLHVLLMEHLPPSYLAIYIDVLQTLHAKLPQLVDKMIFGSMHNAGQELLGPVLKKPWEPIVTPKNRQLPGHPFIVVVPSVPNMLPTPRQQKWFTLFSTMSPVVVIQPPSQPQDKAAAEKQALDKQPLQLLAENMVAMTRAKIQQVRSSAPNRSIILVGFDAGSALAVQVALVESISCVICLGFSYNTYNGVRGAPDDHLIDITCPVLFVIGQNSARASHEEMEMLRDRMSSHTALVVVGAADECLRVSKTKRKIEGVTQSMVDNMVADEIAEFATNCLVSPPRPKHSTSQSETMPEQSVSPPLRNDSDLSGQRKRKHAPDSKAETKQQQQQQKKPYNRRGPKIIQSLELSQSTPQEVLDIAVQSIMPTSPEKQIKSEKIILPLAKSDEVMKYEIRESGGAQIISARASTPIVLPALKRDHLKSPLASGGALQQQQQGNVNVKMIESNQLIHLKPSAGTTQKFYSITSSTKPVMSVMANSSPTVNESSVVASSKMSSPTKYTIVRNTGSTPTVYSNVGEPNTAGKASKSLSETNIFDLPIVFADNDGVIQEGSPEKQQQQQQQQQESRSAGVTVPVAPAGGIVTVPPAVQTTGNRFVTLQQSAGSIGPISIGKSKQVIILPKGTLKPVDSSMIQGAKINLPVAVASSSAATPATASAQVGTVVSTANTGQKFAKVVLTKPISSGTTTNTTSVMKNLSDLFSGGKLEFVNSAGVRQTVVTGTPLTGQQGKFQSIIINSYGANKAVTPTGGVVMQTSSAGGSPTTTGTVTNVVGGSNIVIKTTPPQANVGRNVTLKKINIVSTSTAVKQGGTHVTSPEAAKKEK